MAAFERISTAQIDQGDHLMKTYTWTQKGEEYTLTERLVQVGVTRWAKKPVYDLKTKYGTSHYDEKGLAFALAARFQCSHSTAVKLITRFKRGELRSAYAMPSSY